MAEPIRLNIGCGESKFEGYINIDLEPSTKPDLLLDLRTNPLPQETDSVNEIIASHWIEHVEFRFWDQIFTEFHRVLIPSGVLILAYPEFKVCAQNYINNFRGMREYWRATLYGRQLYLGDYHITPVNSVELSAMLEVIGFRAIEIVDDKEGPHYKMLTCLKLATRRSQEERLVEEFDL